jgi:cytoskeletal protein CcmA (bactofilin family)
MAIATQPRPLVRTGRDRPTFISSDLHVVGNVVSKGEMQVDGEVKGDIRSSSLIVNKAALIKGNIIAESVVVHGTVHGVIRAKHVMLQAGSQLEGEIFYQTFGIEPGAIFNGQSRRVDDPTTGKTL